MANISGRSRCWAAARSTTADPSRCHRRPPHLVEGSSKAENTWKGDAVRIFLAGATGAVGRRLVPLLVQAGHDVVGTTRDPKRVQDLEAAGAQGVILDALDGEAVKAA